MLKFEQFIHPTWQQAHERTGALELHQIAQAFHNEVAYRHAFENYCRWYVAIAQQHQEELKQMQQEPNLLSWFQGHRNR